MRQSGADSTPIVAASAIAFLALLVIITAVGCIVYRKRKDKNATTFPVWESNDRSQFEKCQSLEDYSFKEEQETQEPFISNMGNDKAQSNV